jgi:hypothetical protein
LASQIVGIHTASLPDTIQRPLAEDKLLRATILARAICLPLSVQVQPFARDAVVSVQIGIVAQLGGTLGHGNSDDEGHNSCRNSAPLRKPGGDQSG